MAAPTHLRTAPVFHVKRRGRSRGLSHSARRGKRICGATEHRSVSPPPAEQQVLFFACRKCSRGSAKRPTFALLRAILSAPRCRAGAPRHRRGCEKAAHNSAFGSISRTVAAHATYQGQLWAVPPDPLRQPGDAGQPPEAPMPDESAPLTQSRQRLSMFHVKHCTEYALLVPGASRHDVSRETRHRLRAARSRRIEERRFT
jgi:hypothetical protein